MEGSVSRATREDGMRLVKEGSFKEAVEVLERIVDVDHTDAQSFLYLGVAYCELGCKAEAISAFEQSVSLKSAPRGHYNLGLGYESVERLGEAMTQYEFALRLDPNHKMAQDGVKRLHKLGVQPKESLAQWTIGAKSVGEEMAENEARRAAEEEARRKLDEELQAQLAAQPQNSKLPIWNRLKIVKKSTHVQPGR